MKIGDIGLIGAGNIGSAFVRGWVGADAAMASRLVVADAAGFVAERLAEETGVTVAGSNRELVERCDLVLVAVKPGDIESSLTDCLDLFGMGKIIVSLAAGRTTTSLEMLFTVGVPVIRLMPNVAVAVGAGTLVLATGEHVDLETEEMVTELLAPLGRIVTLPEKLFSAATAISGSGPGFMALIADGFIDAGVMAGLPGPVSRELTVSMLEGTARLLIEEGLSPTELRHRVTSPAGTTAAGLAQLERDGVRSAIIDAVQVTVHRSNELG
ncbi:MAG: pyrroline-5-carboxylate reductase [Gaiellales bacterium]|nr:MAG: pyrroline-5-carboxylate reductase [Gaiellales bacterium]